MSRFQNRNEFITARASEKITLAHVHGKARLYVFSGPTLDIYSKVVPYFVSGMEFDGNVITPVFSITDVQPGTFYYDIKTSTVHVILSANQDPRDGELVATYRFFFSSKSLDTTWNLSDTAQRVFYDGRIQSSPAYDHKIGFEQNLTSVVGSGTLKLLAQDDFIDSIFETIIFENQQVDIYSWNDDLNPSESKVIYRGRVTNKSFDGDMMTFKVKDQSLALLESPNLQAYSDEDNVGDSVKGQYKRRVYGRVDGLRCQSISQIGNGITHVGSFIVESGSNQVVGLNTQFSSTVLQGDTIILNTIEFTVDQVLSDTSIILSDEANFTIQNSEYTVVNRIGSPAVNREYQVTGHAGARITKVVTSALQLNRVVLDDTDGLVAGDFIEFVATGERIRIRTVAPGNLIVLSQNVLDLPPVGSQVIRRPVQNVYIEGRLVPADGFTVSNDTTNGVRIIFNDDVEQRLARTTTPSLQFNFVNGDNLVTVNAEEITLSDIVQPGDYIKPDQLNSSDFSLVLTVNDDSLVLATDATTTTTDKINIQRPNYLLDNTVVSCDVLGKTRDGQPAGEWISTASGVIEDLITDAGIQVYNEQSFQDGRIDNNQLISMAVPLRFNSKVLPNTKTLVDLINQSVQSSLTLDNNLLLKYQALNVYSQEDLFVIDDFHVISWKVNTTNGKQFRTANASYRFTDVERSSLQDGNGLVSFSSQFIDRYIGTNVVNDISLHLYEEDESLTAAQRTVYYNRLSISRVEITTDLRLENIEIGDVVTLNFDRLYNRLGDSNTRNKNVLVVGKRIDGERIRLTCSDLGNTFNTSSYITPDTAPCYADATTQERLIYGFITDSQGIVDDDEDTAGIHLIS